MVKVYNKEFKKQLVKEYIPGKSYPALLSLYYNVIISVNSMTGNQDNYKKEKIRSNTIANDKILFFLQLRFC